MSGGSAGGGGYDFQARIVAYVAVHIIAQRPLAWVRLPLPAIPLAVSSETAGAGDDVRIEIVGGPVFELQAKKGLKRGADFDKAIDRFVSLLPTAPEQHGILAVDPNASGPIREDLAKGLDRLGSGRDDDLPEIAEEVRARADALGGESALSRLHVVTLDLLADTSPLRLLAIEMLRGVLEDTDGAEVAWDALIAEGLRIVRERGRHDAVTLAAFFASRSLPLLGVATPVRTEVHETYLAVQRIEEHLSVAAVQTSAEPTPSDVPWSARLDVIRDLLNQWRPNSALASLRTIQSELFASDVGAAVRARFYNLLGLALLRTGHSVDAQEVLQRALDHEPGNNTALLNLAATWHALGDEEAAVDAARKVIEKDPSSSGAWTILVLATHALGYSTAVPQEVETAPDTASAVASLVYKERRWSDGIELLERSFAAHGRRDPQRLVLLAEGLWARAEFTPDAKRDEDLSSAERLASEAIEALNQAEDPGELARVLVLRSSIRRSTNRVAEASADLKKALEVDPSTWRTAFVASSDDLDRGDPESALHRLARFTGGDFPAPVHLMRARALAALGRYSEVNAALKAALAAHADDDELVETQYAAAEVAINAELYSLAVEVLEAIPEVQRNWYWSLFMARIEVRRGDILKAKALYREAIERAEGKNRNVARVEFGTVLSRQNEFDAAIEQYELAGADHGDEHSRERYARALYNKGELTRASTLLDAAERDGIESMWALELGSLIAHRRKDPATEQGYLERMLLLDPADASTAIRLASALLRQGKRERLPTLLADLRTRTDLAGWQVVQIAELHLEAGEPEHALPLAYRAVRLEPDDPGIQLAFVNIFLHREDEERGLDPEEVGPDTHATLESFQGEKLGYLILSEGPADIRRDEFLASDPRVAKLLGKRVGDLVVLRSGTPTETQYRLTEIKHAIVHVFQDTMLHFGHRHPENTALQKFQVGPEPTKEDFAFLFKSLEQSKARGEVVMAMYREQGMPLGFIAHLLGKSLPDVYVAFAGLRGELLYVEFPDFTSMRETVDLAGSAESVVVTRSALVTARELDLSGFICARYPQLVVPQSLVDELDEEVRALRLSLREGRKTMLAVEGGFTMHEESPEDTQRYYHERQELVAWVRAHCRVAPLPFEATTDEAETWRERFGDSSLDSYMLSVCEGIPLYTDDLGLRRLTIGPGEQRAQGFSTIAMLIAAANDGHLLPLELHRHAARLVRLNHTHVPVSADTLFTALVDASFELDEQTLILFDRLRSAHSENLSAVGVVAELLQKVTLYPKDATVTSVANLCFECLADGHPQPETFRLLVQMIRRRLSLLPEARHAIETALSAFLESKMLGGNL